MKSPESNRTEKESIPLQPKAEFSMGGYRVYFSSEDEARKAILDFWSRVSPPSDLEEITRSLQSGRDLRDIMITSVGKRTEYSPVRKEIQDEGYKYGVFFSGNGAPLQTKGIETLIDLGYLSL